jgi:putative membrane protein
MNYTNKGADLVLARRLNLIAYAVSAVVLGLVVLMRSPQKLSLGVDFSFLPPVHALLNGTTAVLLLLSLYFIKQKNVTMHQRSNYAAFGCSAVFLLCYVLYHATTKEIRFGDIDHSGVVTPDEIAAIGGIRMVYLVLLLSHIALAAISFPFILLTFIRAYTRQYDSHRRMARWVYPMWLYVAITGPICYLMLKPYY